MSTPNSRFKLLGPGILTEMIAHQTQLLYNPSVQSIEALFTGSPFLRVENRYVPVGNEMDILRLDLTPRLAERPAKAGDLDPVTGVDLSNVSVAGVMVIMKRAYDNFHNERAAMMAAQLRAIENNDISAYPTNATEYNFSGLNVPTVPTGD